MAFIVNVFVFSSHCGILLFVQVASLYIYPSFGINLNIPSFSLSTIGLFSSLSIAFFSVNETLYFELTKYNLQCPFLALFVILNFHVFVLKDPVNLSYHVKEFFLLSTVVTDKF